MKVDPSGQRRRWSGRIRRFAAPVPMGVAGLALLVADVSHPEPPAYGGLDTWQLRRLLRGLAAEGLVLPRDVGLLAPHRF
jgi:hypothetical protein